MSTLTTQDRSVLLPRPGAAGNARLYGIDWLRAIAAVLVVMLHAAIPYMNDPLPGLRWSIETSDRSDAVSLIGWWIDGFIMPLFFLMTGYFAARLYQRRGANAFLQHRFARIGGPLLFGMIVILPLDLYAWLLGWVGDGLIPIHKLRSLKVREDLAQALYGVSHLWYLEYLLLYCFAAYFIGGAIRRIMRPARDASSENKTLPLSARRRDGRLLFSSGLIFLAACLAGGTILWWQPRIVIGFRHGWLPYWENLLYYALPFAGGWFWDRWIGCCSLRTRYWIGGTVAAMLTFGILWPELRMHLAHERIPVSRAGMPFLFAGFGFTMSVAAFGLALSIRLQEIAGTVSYLSRASFWIYLFHHPVVGLTHVDLKHWNMSPFAKFLLTSLIALAVCLMTYEGLVRTTWIGQLLNGTRDQRRVVPATDNATPTQQPAPLSKRAA